jgi:hypothetical protein
MRAFLFCQIAIVSIWATMMIGLWGWGFGGTSARAPPNPHKLSSSYEHCLTPPADRTASRRRTARAIEESIADRRWRG